MSGPRFGAALLGFALAAAAVGRAQVAPVRPSALIDSPQLLRDLQTLSADGMQGREVGTAGGAKARAYVLERFKASGVAAFPGGYEEPFAVAAGRASGGAATTGVNVVGYIDGARQPRRFLVVSAHYDHIGVKNGEVFNGADDNASGTAALFAIARYFRAHRPMNSLLIAAFDGEEEGLLGSRAFLEAPPVDRGALVVDLNADMIGRDPNDKLFVVGVRAQPFLGPTIARVAASAPVKLIVGHDDPKTGEDDWTEDSDQFAFVERRIPGLYFGVEDYAQHHRATDDYETITYDFYIRSVETMIAVIQAFDADADRIVKASHAG